MRDVPVACTLGPAEFASRRDTLLPGLIARAAGSEALPDGMRWRFAPSQDLLIGLAAVIDAERRCCPFLRFQVVVEADGGSVWLAVTGPPGTREFLTHLSHR
jgi:hypothetical protein